MNTETIISNDSDCYTFSNIKGSWLGYCVSTASQKHIQPVSDLHSSQEKTLSYDDFFTKDAINKISRIMDGDVIYIKYSSSFFDLKNPQYYGSDFDIQINKDPDDWNNSIKIYSSVIYGENHLKKAYDIVRLLATIITMSGRDVIVNDIQYTIQ